MRLFSRFSSVKQKSSDCFPYTHCKQELLTEILHIYLPVYVLQSIMGVEVCAGAGFQMSCFVHPVLKIQKKMFGLAFTGERKQKMFTFARWNCNFILVLLHGVFSFHSWSFIFTRSSSWQHHNSFCFCRFVLSSTIFMHFCRAGCTKQDIFHLFSVIFGHRKRI